MKKLIISILLLTLLGCVDQINGKWPEPSPSFTPIPTTAERI